MLDLRFILENPDLVREALKSRSVSIDLDEIQALDSRRKSCQKEHDDLRSHQNKVSEEIARRKKNKELAQETSDNLLVQMKDVAVRVKSALEEMASVEAVLRERLLQIPNIPQSSVPIGPDASANREVRRWGTIPEFSFKPREHGDIGESLGLFDFTRASKISGARFTLYKGLGAALERALIHFMIDMHVEKNGYTEVLPPFLVNAQSLLGTGQLPKFEEDLFKTTMGYYLIPTAEVPVTNIFRDEILSESDLPISYVAHTPCFRSEAGAAGKDTKGLIRQHQFNKVELVKFTRPEDSNLQHEKLTQDAESILQKLELPYRVITLATGDMGFSSAKTYDIEVWFPGQGVYREISSCSNFESFQARRANIRFKRSGGNSKPEFVHTLNGSGLAVGRTVAAILEIYQEEKFVRVPEALKPYLKCDVIAEKIY